MSAAGTAVVVLGSLGTLMLVIFVLAWIFEGFRFAAAVIGAVVAILVSTFGLVSAWLWFGRAL